MPIQTLLFPRIRHSPLYGIFPICSPANEGSISACKLSIIQEHYICSLASFFVESWSLNMQALLCQNMNHIWYTPIKIALSTFIILLPNLLRKSDMIVDIPQKLWIDDAMYRHHFWLHIVQIIGMPTWHQLYRYEPLLLNWQQLIWKFVQSPRLYSLLFSAGKNYSHLAICINVKQNIRIWWISSL